MSLMWLVLCSWMCVKVASSTAGESDACSGHEKVTATHQIRAATTSQAHLLALISLYCNKDLHSQPVLWIFANKISWNTCAKVKGSKRHLLQRGRGSKLHSSISTCMWSTGAETSACCELSAPGSFHFCYLIKCFTSIGGCKTSLNSSMSVIFSVCS